MKDNKNYRSNANYYMEGSAARNLHELPRYEEEKLPQLRKVKKTKRMVSPSIDLFSIVVLTGAIILTLFTCVDYLKVQSSIVSMNKNIAKLESNLTKLEDENQASLAMINTALDLNYIYQVATSELGMVYPNDNQVITYESTLSDYVRQYEDIPEANSSSFMDKLLNK